MTLTSTKLILTRKQEEKRKTVYKIVSRRRKGIHLNVIECYFRVVRCSLSQTCALVHIADFPSFLHFLLILSPDSVQHFCRKNVFVKC